ncbi:hypothetical protein D3C78_1400800 [compost metagenome]
MLHAPIVFISGRMCTTADKGGVYYVYTTTFYFETGNKEKATRRVLASTGRQGRKKEKGAARGGCSWSSAGVFAGSSFFN